MAQPWKHALLRLLLNSLSARNRLRSSRHLLARVTLTRARKRAESWRLSDQTQQQQHRSKSKKNLSNFWWSVIQDDPPTRRTYVSDNHVSRHVSKTDDHLTLRYKLVDMMNQVLKKETKFPCTIKGRAETPCELKSGNSQYASGSRHVKTSLFSRATKRNYQ